MWLTVSRYLASLKAVLAPGKRDEAAGEAGQPSEVAEASYGGGSGEIKDLIMKEEEEGSNVKEETLDQLTPGQTEANRRQFERTNQLVRQFMLNEGPQLQRDLKEYANKCQNWVSLNFIYYNCVL